MGVITPNKKNKRIYLVDLSKVTNKGKDINSVKFN